MSGREAVVVTVHLPSEMSFNLPLKFDESTRRFTCPLLWVEVGDHHITVTLAGEVVPGCPFVVRVHDPDEEFGEIEDEPQESNAMSMVPADNSNRLRTRTTRKQSPRREKHKRNKKKLKLKTRKVAKAKTTK